MSFYVAAQALIPLLRDADLLTKRSELDVAREDADKEVTVSFMSSGCKISVVVTSYWMYPHQVCYFVNVSLPNGNTLCQAGTNREMLALVNIGRAIQFASSNEESLLEIFGDEPPLSNADTPQSFTPPSPYAIAMRFSQP